jgi:hypothetical protein
MRPRLLPYLYYTVSKCWGSGSGMNWDFLNLSSESLYFSALWNLATIKTWSGNRIWDEKMSDPDPGCLWLRNIGCYLLKVSSCSVTSFRTIFSVMFDYEAFLFQYFFICVIFGLFRNRYVCFGCFQTGPKQQNKPKKYIFGFTKQTEKQPKQIEFRFEPKIKFVCFKDTLPQRYE